MLGKSQGKEESSPPTAEHIKQSPAKGRFDIGGNEAEVFIWCTSRAAQNCKGQQQEQLVKAD